ncbi:MAG TPA: alpha/beta hydrolase [Candidatus Limnocylindrales bacterium]|nr:alpha/beta hydrolase [Candidatus Limnocylindrales bacterium]
MDEILQAPASSGVIREVRGLIELPRLLLRFPVLALQPRGNGEPILLLPGHGMGDGSTVILKAYLRLIGYRARGLGLGRNMGSITDLLPRVLKRVTSFSRRSDQKVTLIGWSFGGYVAREIARERPDLVRQVITLGTPVIGGPKYTAVAKMFRQRGMDIEAIAAEVERRNHAVLLETPVVAIYSRGDAVVAWEACIDRLTPNVEHVEVRTTHLGLGFSAEVYKIIARALAKIADKQPPRADPMPKHRHGVQLRRHTRVKA